MEGVGRPCRAMEGEMGEMGEMGEIGEMAEVAEIGEIGDPAPEPRPVGTRGPGGRLESSV